MKFLYQLLRDREAESCAGLALAPERLKNQLAITFSDAFAMVYDLHHVIVPNPNDHSPTYRLRAKGVVDEIGDDRFNRATIAAHEHRSRRCLEFNSALAFDDERRIIRHHLPNRVDEINLLVKRRLTLGQSRGDEHLLDNRLELACVALQIGFEGWLLRIFQTRTHDCKRRSQFMRVVGRVSAHSRGARVEPGQRGVDGVDGGFDLDGNALEGNSAIKRVEVYALGCARG